MEPIETKNGNIKEPNEPGSDRGYGCMILEKPPESETLERDAVRFHSEVAELTREVFGEDKSVVFASGLLAGMELEKSRLKRWAADESEPLPEGEHQAVDESEADEVIEEAVAEAETTKGGDINESVQGKRAKKSLKFTVESIEEILNGWQPDFQKAVLKVVTERQPERDALAAEENRRQDATDGLHEIIDTWPTEKVESLSRLLASEEFTEKLHLQVA